MVNVVFDRVQKAFGQVLAIPDLNLTIEAGEFVSLLGPSGCGKTTTLRMLAGLEHPTGGQISIGERPVNNVAPGERDIAMVFQSYALYPHMSVAQNIAYPTRTVARPQAQAAFRRAAAACGIGPGAGARAQGVPA
jgi:multiple sugar transport system ATP-binding protein